jgi:intracellular septation protein
MRKKLLFFVSSTFLNLCIEFGPIALFFIAFELFSFMMAVVVLMASVAAALLASVFIQKRVAVFPIVSSGSVLVFGGLTLYLNNPAFIIVKDTLYFGLFGVAILWTLASGKLILKRMFNSLFAISDEGWRTVSLRWGVCMVAFAAANEVARHVLSAERWVEFKFIALIVMFVFAFWQFRVSRAFRLPEANAWGLRVVSSSSGLK